MRQRSSLNVIWINIQSRKVENENIQMEAKFLSVIEFFLSLHWNVNTVNLFHEVKKLTNLEL